MIVTNALRNLIREGRTPQMASSMLTGAEMGSITMDNCLIDMVVDGKIDIQTAIEAAHDQDYVQKKLKF